MSVKGWVGRLSRRVPAAPSQSLAWELLLIGGICILLWAGIFLLLDRQRSDKLREAVRETENLARAFEENIARTVGAVDRTLLSLRSAYVAADGQFDLAAWQRDVQALDDLTLQIAIVDPDGRMRMSTLGTSRPGLNLSDREHFRVQRDSPADALFISKPLLGRQSDRWSLQFSRKIVGRDGAFAGVGVVSVDPYRLAGFYEAVHIGRGSIMLIGLDGIVRSAAPVGADMLGRDVNDTPLLADARSRPDGMLKFALPNRSAQIMSYRRLDRYGLIVAVGLDRDDVLADYVRSRTEYLVGGGIVTVLILSVGSSVLIRRRVLLHTQAELIHSEQMLTDTLENMSQGIFMVDRDRRLAVANRRAAELLGVPPGVVMAGRSFDDLLRWQLDSGEFENEQMVRRLAETGGLELTDSVYERARPNGTFLEVRTRILDDDRAVRTFTDITDRKRAEARILYLAHHDDLTGLANRARFQECLAHAVKLGAGGQFAVLAIDLDRFKQVNDGHGHHVGDQLLRAVAERIRSCVREDDIVARFGGDEFAVAQTNVQHPAAVAALAERLVSCLGEPYELRGAQVVVGASIGVALFPTDGRTEEDLLKNSDIALYKAKRDGRGTFCFFKPEMDAALQERYALECDLREALAHDRLEVNFQPICHAVSGRLLAFEALARWTHPTRGPVSPQLFVSLAEETGQIGRLGLVVLRAACREAATWPETIRLNVNLSPLQFLDPHLDRQIIDILAETGLEPARLGLEVTEGALIRNGDEALASMHALRKWGVRIYLDDFGTGHAGLSYLLRFPFDCIKIDRSFIGRLAHDGAAEAVIRAVMLLGERLELDVVAEGVETEVQRAQLINLGCAQIQGFLLGKPRTASEALDYCTGRASEPAPLFA